MFGNSGSLYDPPFSLKRTAKFRHERLTRSRGVVPDIRYYVADGFSAKHARDGYALRRQEQNVESEYQTHLRYGCFSARQRYSQFKNAARFSPRAPSSFVRSTPQRYKRTSPTIWRLATMTPTNLNALLTRPHR